MGKRAKFIAIGQFVGLEGMPPKIRGWHARSPSDAVRVLKAKRIATAAGDTGCITVWMPKGGGIRAEFQRNYTILSAETFQTSGALRAWLREWWPHMNAESRYVVPKAGGRRKQK